tara:strand:- start:167 stop:2092 length:1926 start_codon:yes stop_codon:yes gene_type:complete
MTPEDIEGAHLIEAARTFEKTNDTKLAQRYLDENNLNYLHREDGSYEKGSIFQEKNTKKVKLAYTGTDVTNVNDLVADTSIATGNFKQSDHVKRALEMYKKGIETGQVNEILGFSLGGATAHEVAGQKNLPARIYNPALGVEAISDHALGKAPNKTTIVKTAGDPISVATGLVEGANGLNEITGRPAMGQSLEVRQIAALQKNVGNALARHGGDNFHDQTSPRADGGVESTYHDVVETAGKLKEYRMLHQAMDAMEKGVTQIEWKAKHPNVSDERARKIWESASKYSEKELKQKGGNFEMQDLSNSDGFETKSARGEDSYRNIGRDFYEDTFMNRMGNVIQGSNELESKSSVPDEQMRRSDPDPDEFEDISLDEEESLIKAHEQYADPDKIGVHDMKNTPDTITSENERADFANKPEEGRLSDLGKAVNEHQSAIDTFSNEAANDHASAKNYSNNLNEFGGNVAEGTAVGVLAGSVTGALLDKIDPNMNEYEKSAINAGVGSVAQTTGVQAVKNVIPEALVTSGEYLGASAVASDIGLGVVGGLAGTASTAVLNKVFKPTSEGGKVTTSVAGNAIGGGVGGGLAFGAGILAGAETGAAIGGFLAPETLGGSVALGAALGTAVGAASYGVGKLGGFVKGLFS